METVPKKSPIIKIEDRIKCSYLIQKPQHQNKNIWSHYCELQSTLIYRFYWWQLWNCWELEIVWCNIIKPLSANPTKCSNTLKKFAGFCQRIVWVCLTILWGWRFKWLSHFRSMFHFHTPWNWQKTSCFLKFSGGIEIEHWHEMG